MTSRIAVSLTGTGWAMILGGIFLYSSARSNDNNLLYLIGAALSAIIVSHFIAGWRNLRGLSIRWHPPDECFAEHDFHPMAGVSETDGRQHFQLSLQNEYFEELNENGSLFFRVNLKMPFRGKHKFETLELFSFYPFGLSRFSLEIPTLTAWAYPAPKPSSVCGVQESLQTNSLPSVDIMGDYWMMREYHQGEDSRQINWRSSAKTDSEWVMVLAQPRQEPLRIWLDFKGVSGEDLEVYLRYISGIIFGISISPIALQLWIAGSPDVSPGWFDLRHEKNRRTAWKWLAGLSECDSSTAIPSDPHEGFPVKPESLRV